LYQATNAAELPNILAKEKRDEYRDLWGRSRPRTAVSQRAKAKKRKRFFARFKDALAESRRQQARRMIEDHAYLLPNDPDSPV
jgi:hypothetical protein